MSNKPKAKTLARRAERNSRKRPVCISLADSDLEYIGTRTAPGLRPATAVGLYIRQTIDAERGTRK